MQLSKNFSLSEMTKSDTAARKGIENTPTETHKESKKLLEIKFYNLLEITAKGKE